MCVCVCVCVYVCVCVHACVRTCVCVSLPPRLFRASGVMWHDSLKRSLKIVVCIHTYVSNKMEHFSYKGGHGICVSKH